MVAQVLVGDPVQFIGAHPRGDRLGGLGQGAGGQPPRDPDPLDRLGVLDLRGSDALGPSWNMYSGRAMDAGT